MSYSLKTLNDEFIYIDLVLEKLTNKLEKEFLEMKKLSLKLI